VLDSSAVLATLNDEPGGAAALAAAHSAAVSAVNFAEVVAKLVARGLPEEAAVAAVRGFGFEVASVDDRQAETAAVLHARTRHWGISLGDAFCLALAKALGRPVLTADRRWKELDVGVEISLIR
jgi:PIN domain nuclease of toxin-antitoxin system